MEHPKSDPAARGGGRPDSPAARRNAGRSAGSLPHAAGAESTVPGTGPAAGSAASGSEVAAGYPAGAYPTVRMRRNRSTRWVRRMTAETKLNVNDLLWPVFVTEGDDVEQPVPSMPDVYRRSVNRLVEQVAHAKELGIPAVAVFPHIEADKKTPACEEAWNPDNLVCRAVREIKRQVPDIGVICDVALDPFNALGHDGLVQDGEILNDETVAALIRQSVVQAEAGCDIIAPSDMMDGRVGAIRAGLDRAGYADVKIMSYAAKYASAFYGPFRDAVGSGGALTGDKATYQMNPANTDEALREVELDLQEGADMVMVKPGMPYLDIVHRVKQAFRAPTFVYQVSGEYAMLKAAAQQGWLDNDKVALESVLAFKRAGADGVLTYLAVEVAEQLNKGWYDRP
ncbi:porphobilinogen synthase [Rhodovibrio sodomensis]|uniref:Delta-aminolevulinic acid dehydratase n=1 Tax=Rhodovibrio sodomensis TaxID=1088 RepID=A0ABS1DEY7_9PROT|nr:porphobilinogen synthase [Rhodovibrio sodomensis]MBK1668103.1 porphobilinogen synthase [Rhodovibrio sodomensis]